jgi:TonB-dependent receptor
MKYFRMRTGLLLSTVAMCATAIAGTARAAETPADRQSDAPAVAPQHVSPQHKDDVQSDASLRDSILVVGNRYQAAAAQVRAINTINVLSADDLSHTAVHNVAEALALLPAVSTTNTGTGFIGGVDAASRGEAMYAQVRGMDTSYSLSMINGVNVAQANPYSRNVQLNLLPPSGLSTIVLNLTATADQEADFISGAIDFHTPSAYDFAKDHLSITVGVKAESEARAYGNDKLGQSYAGEWSKQFGSEGQFGIYAQAYYDVRYFTNGKVGGINETHSDNAWGYAIQGGGTNSNNSAPGINPVDNIVMAGVNESVADGQTKRYGGSVAFDWRPSSATKFFARFTYARADTVDNIANSQIIGQGPYGGNNGMAAGTDGIPLGNGTYGLVIPDLSLRYWFITNPQANTLGTSQIGGETSNDHLAVSGSAFFSSGADNMPNQIQVATRNLDNGGNGVAFGGSQLFTYNAHNYPIALLNSYQQSVLDNIPGMPADNNYGAPELTNYRSVQSMAGLKSDVTYKFDSGVLKYIKTGFKILDSWHQTSNVDYQIDGKPGGNGQLPSTYTTFGSEGLISNTWAHAIPGLYAQPVPNLDVNKIFALYNTLAADPAVGTVADDCGGNGTPDTIANATNCNSTRTLEHYRSGYVLANLSSGNFEVIPGLRYEGTWIRNTYWVIPNGAVGAFQSDRGKEVVWLPSIYLNYRPNSQSVYRASVWTSYIRPPFVELGAGATESVSGNGANQVITIQKGNPNLKPVQAINFDTSAEWTSSHGGHLMVQLYAKRLRDYIYDSGNSAGNYVTTPQGQIATIVPVNGGDASVEGFDIEARQRFQDLPAPFDGLGVSGNVTLQHSHVNLGGSSGTFNYQDQIANTPSVLGNLGVFYRKNGYSIDINYNYQGAAVQNYDWFGLGNSSDDVWTKAVGRVDLHLGREFNNRLKLDIAVSNLLNATTYFAHVGKNNYAESDIVFSGVTGAFNLTYKY